MADESRLSKRHAYREDESAIKQSESNTSIESCDFSDSTDHFLIIHEDSYYKSDEVRIHRSRAKNSR